MDFGLIGWMTDAVLPAIGWLAGIASIGLALSLIWRRPAA